LTIKPGVILRFEEDTGTGRGNGTDDQQKNNPARRFSLFREDSLDKPRDRSPKVNEDRQESSPVQKDLVGYSRGTEPLEEAREENEVAGGAHGEKFRQPLDNTQYYRPKICHRAARIKCRQQEYTMERIKSTEIYVLLI